MIFAFVLVAYVFQMSTILWLFQNLISVTIISIFVLFQPELRRALEQLGRKNLLSSVFNLSSGAAVDEQAAKVIEKTKSEIIKALSLIHICHIYRRGPDDGHYDKN